MNKVMELDNPAHLKSLDPQGMIEALAGFPEQCRAAARLEIELSKDYSEIDNVVLCGMGGSAIAGDLAQALLAPTLSRPFATIRGYVLPGSVSGSTLLLINSYSGMTEETVASLKLGLDKGARIAAVTSGGKIEEICRERALPYVKIPAGYQPRAALAFLLIPVLKMLEQLRLTKGPLDGQGVTAAAERAAEHLSGLIESYQPGAPIEDNRAKDLAARLHGKLPVIYGSQEFCYAPALRFKCQINENAKQAAFAGALPETSHNEIEGWLHPAEICRSAHLLFLRDRDDHAQIGRRIEVIRDVVGREISGSEEIRSSGESLLSRLLSLVVFGDWVSVYLAFLNGMDPSPVERISILKERLTR